MIQHYQFPWSTLAGEPIDMKIEYQDGDILRVWMEGTDISEILDNPHLSEMLYDSLYEYDKDQRGNY